MESAPALTWNWRKAPAGHEVERAERPLSADGLVSRFDIGLPRAQRDHFVETGACPPNQGGGPIARAGGETLHDGGLYAMLIQCRRLLPGQPPRIRFLPTAR